MRGVVSTTLAAMVGGLLAVAGSAPFTAPARAAAHREALPRTAMMTSVGAATDCTIFSGSPTSAAQCGGASDSTAGTDGNGALYRTMASFPNLDIPAGSTVNSATLTIQVLGAFGSTAATVLDMTRGFAPGAATWDTYDGVHPWSAAGGDFEATPHTTVSVTAPGAVSFSIPALIQPWADGTDPVPQLMILGFSGTGNAFTFGNVAHANGPVLSVNYTPPPPPTAPPSTGPVVTTPVQTQLPVSKGSRALRVKVALSWTWNGPAIRLRKVKVGTMPGDTKLTMGCSGTGCPRHSGAKVSGARKVRRALLRLAGRRYRAGDVLTVTLSAARYRPERARIFFRDGTRPLLLG